MPKELINSFKQSLVNIKNQKNIRIEKAFIHWYLDTRFGKSYNKCITDGPKDGGIDAIAVRDKTYYIVQAEFCNDIFDGKTKISPLSPKKYAQFDALPDIFRDDLKFEQYLQTLDTSLHSKYTEISEHQKANPSCVIWEIVTMHSRSIAGERRLRNIDVVNIRYASDNLRLYELSLEGATPPAAPLELNFTEHFIVDDKEIKIRTYVASTFIRDFIHYIDHDPEFHVLAKNVRSELKDTAAKKIKKEIIKTYENCPREFWYSHNGITIICDKATIKGKKITMISPYIINGAQTIHALRGLRKRDQRAKVLVRIIEIPSGGSDINNFINAIIFRTNQQNKMYAYDLRANDTIQVQLANEFWRQRIFYERRRGDWDLNKRVYKNQGYTRLKSIELAQILMSCDQRLGGVDKAKKSKEDLFSDRNYNALFDLSFEEIFFKFKIFQFVRECIKLFKTKKINQRERNHALLSCFAVVWNCLDSHKKLNQLYSINNLHPHKLSLKNKFSKDLKKVVQDIFKTIWNKWREEHSRDENLSANNFFKSSKWNDILIRKFCPKYMTKVQRCTNSMLEKN